MRLDFATDTGSGTIESTPPNEVPTRVKARPDIGFAGLRAALRLQLNARRLAEPSKTDASSPAAIQPDGYGLASVISYLASTRSPALARIEAALARVVPQSKQLSAPPAVIGTEPPHEASGHRLQLEYEGGAKVDADLLSEGTLLVIGILTALHASSPQTLLLDDFDHALHPQAQEQLVACLRDQLAERPELQIVCTSHSPYALDHFQSDEVRVMKLDTQGHAHCKPLSAHPEWPKWQGTIRRWREPRSTTWWRW